MRAIDAGAFLLLGAIWGSSFLFIKWAATAFPPITLVAMRMTLAATIMIIFNLIYSYFKPDYRDTVKHHVCGKHNFILKVLIMGFLNNSIPFTLVAWAESKPDVNVGVASVLDSTIPLFGQLLGHFLLPNESLTIKRAIGLIIGFGGVFVVCANKIFDLDDAEAVQSASTSVLIGYYMMIICATISYALASVWGKRKLSGFNPVVTATGQIICGCLINVFLSLSWDYSEPADEFTGRTHYSFIPEAPYKAWIAIAYLGTCATCVAYSLYFYLLRTIGSVRQTMVGFLLPVFGVFEGAMFNGDWESVGWQFKLMECSGALLIGVGIWFVIFGDKIKLGDGESSPLIPTAGENGAASNSVNDTNRYEYENHGRKPSFSYQNSIEGNTSINNIQSYA